MSFVHLNVHTHYSILEALGKPSEYIAKAKSLGMDTLAITDSGALYGLIEFYDECKKNGIKSILGMEISVAATGRFNKTDENKRYSIILLVKNKTGYNNILKLASKANLEGFYYVPRIDSELLEKYGEGLIGISSWQFGEISQKLLNDKEDEAMSALVQYRSFFGNENFFIEIQNHPENALTPTLNDKLVSFSKQNNIDLVATNGCYYVNTEDKESFEAFACIKKGETINDPNRRKKEGDFSLKSEADMKELFAFCPDACENTNKVAGMIDFALEFGADLLPNFETPDNKDPKDYLKELCLSGLKEKYPEEKREVAVKQLEYELSIINQMGFASYFLIVRDFINFATSNGIIVGPGRGSAAGSIISYVLNITKLDPLEYNLIFERFLNPERVSMPDIDIDFEERRRDEVLSYVVQKYGEDRVAQIITFGTMGAKAAIRDSGRVLGYSYGIVDKIAKMVPNPILGKYKPLKEYLEEARELKDVYQNDQNAKKILDTAIRFEGSVRNLGTHACAVIISPDPLTNHTAIQRAVGDKNGIVTQYSMKPLEKLGLLKMDFLGLSNLSVIEDTIKIIKRVKNTDIDINTIPLHDEKTFQIFQDAQTTGIFQFESAGMKKYLKDLKPTELEDLIAMNSLYRPGPMQFIPDYIKGKHGKKKVTYLHESLEETLKTTYGIAVYQEQILQIAQKFAGFTLGEADLLRRAIGKKIASELFAQRQKFIEGAEKQGHSEKLAVKMFDEVVEPFAGYGFNKAHAACYSLIAYQTAYLKAHFSTAFMTALLSCDSSDTDRVVIEISECENMNINVLPPSINESLNDFTCVDDTNIRFGLSAIKGLGENTALEIIKVREVGGKFTSIEDVAKRVPYNLLNKKTLEALIYSGAMDNLGEQNELASNIESISRFAKSEQQNTEFGQTDIFAILGTGDNDKLFGLELKKAKKATPIEKLRREKSFLGLYVSGHPLRGLAKYFKEKVKLISAITKADVGKGIKIGGIISNLKKIITRSNELMLSFVIEDPTGRVECVIFPKNYTKLLNVIKEDEVSILEGKVDIRADRVQFMVSDGKLVSLETMIENAKEKGVFDEQEKIEFKGMLDFAVKEVPLTTEEDENEFSHNIVFEDQDMVDVKNDQIFTIEIPKGSTSEKLKLLKNLLVQNKSDDGINVRILFDNGEELKIPIKVNMTEDLQTKISEILSD